MSNDHMMNARDIINKITHCKDIDLLLSVVPKFQRAVFQKGAVLLGQGENWDYAYFVQHGLLRTHLVSEDGKDFSKSFYSEGAFIGPITRQLESKPAPFNISALEASVVWQIHIADLRSSLVPLGMWESMCLELLGWLHSQKLQREYDLQVLDAKSRYLKLCQESPDLACRVPLTHLATYLGITDVSLSRIRRQIAQSEH
jgi:CRP-like cAMP-binding protein